MFPLNTLKPDKTCNPDLFWFACLQWHLSKLSTRLWHCSFLEAQFLIFGPLWSVRSMQSWLTQGFSTLGIAQWLPLPLKQGCSSCGLLEVHCFAWQLALQPSSPILCRLPSCALQLGGSQSLVSRFRSLWMLPCLSATPLSLWKHCFLNLSLLSQQQRDFKYNFTLFYQQGSM